MNLYFDTETTSLSPGQICQLSYIMEEGRTVTAKNFFFTVDRIDPSAQAVHGFSVEKLKMLSDGATFETHIDEIAADFAKARVFAHNFPFDFSFMQAEFERCARQFRYFESVCTMRKFTPVCRLPRSNGIGYKYPKLTELTSYFELSQPKMLKATEYLFDCDSSFHDARFDAVGVFLACLAAKERGITL